MLLLLRKQTVHETEMQWPSPHIARVLLCSSNFPAATSSDQCRMQQHHGQGWLLGSCSRSPGARMNRGGSARSW